MGVLHGVADKAVYIPDIYTCTQNRWVDNFLASNGYLGAVISYHGNKNFILCYCSCSEFSVLGRVGIDDPRGYARQRYAEKEGLVILESCCLGPAVLCEVEGALEEMKTTGSWVDALVRGFSHLSRHFSFLCTLLPFACFVKPYLLCLLGVHLTCWYTASDFSVCCVFS